MTRYNDPKYSFDFLTEYAKTLLAPKFGQAQPATTTQNNGADTAGLMGLAKKLVEQIKDKYQTNSLNDNAQIFVKDVQDLPSFITFLRQEQIRTDGQLIVTTQQSQTNNIPYQITLAAPAQAAGGEAGQSTVYIYKDGLIKYLKELLATAEDPQNPNDVLRVMLTRLIGEANQELKLDIKPEQPKETPGAAPSQEKGQAGQNQAQPNQGDASAQATNPQLAKDLQAINNMWPLLPDDINLPRIVAWAQMYAKIAQAEPKLDVQAANKAQAVADDIMNLFQIRQQSLSVPAQSVYNTVMEVMRRLRPTASPAGQVSLYLQMLDDLIDAVEAALFEFRSTFGGDAFQRYLPGLEDQIQAGSSSLAAANRQKIAYWRDNMHTVNPGQW